MLELVIAQMQMGQIVGDYRRGIEKREIEREAVWQARFDMAGHEERMQLLELRKIEEMGKQTKAIKDAADKTADAIKHASREASHRASISRYFD